MWIQAGTMPSANVSVRSLAEEEKYLSGHTAERTGEGMVPGGPASLRRGSSENHLLELDQPDGPCPGGAPPPPPAEIVRSRSCLDGLQQKMLMVTEQLKIEQTARDENLAEYLKLMNSADKQQVGRIKQVFEKKNQKSAQSIAQMQKKLEQYHRKRKDSEVKEIREAQSQLDEDLGEFKGQFQRDYGVLNQTLQEERYRYERLEDQLNDLTELHQNEMSNLKQELSSIEERVAYQAYERARDIQEALESCQTRVSKLELQQQQQQTVQLENHDARVLLGKSINIMLAIVTVLLVCVSTAAKFAAPLMRSRHHLMVTVLGVCFLAVFWRNWDRLQCALERMLVPA
ncbi:unnamed protein product [Boreogadus saida]